MRWSDPHTLLTLVEKIGRREGLGDRIFTLKRLFNVKAGLTKANDTLPERIATLDRTERHRAVPREAFEQMRDEYYPLRQ